MLFGSCWGFSLIVECAHLVQNLDLASFAAIRTLLQLQYVWRKARLIVTFAIGDNVWTEQQEYRDYNAHAGVGCYSWGPGSNTYVLFVDLDDNVNILWKDLNVSHEASPEHPVDEWVKGMLLSRPPGAPSPSKLSHHSSSSPSRLLQQTQSFFLSVGRPTNIY